MPPSPFTDLEFLKLQQQVAELERKLEHSSKEIEELNKNVFELIQVFRDFQGAQRVLEQIARVAKPVIYVLTVVAGYIAWHQTSGRT
jgi:predicted RNase H-like nuclease (RuvC/YqgF family)